MTNDDAELLNEYIRRARRALQSGDTRAALKILDAIAEATEGVPDEPVDEPIDDTARYLTARMNTPIHLTARTPTPSHRCACEGSAWACSFCGEDCHCCCDESVMQLAAA